MKLFLLYFAITLYALFGAISESRAETFAEIELSLGQVIDPAIKYLNCDNLKWYEKIVCKTIASEVTNQLNSAGISIQQDGLVYNKDGIVPNGKIYDNGCSDKIFVNESNLNLKASRDSIFKFEIGSISKPLIFAAKVPTNVNARIRMGEDFGYWIGIPFTNAGWCQFTGSDAFTFDANLTTTANVVAAFSLEPRLIPRLSDQDDYRIEISPRLYVDGYPENVDINFEIHGRDWLFDIFMNALALPGDINKITYDSLTLFTNPSSLNNILELTVGHIVYPLASSALYLDQDLFGTDFLQLFTTELIKRRITGTYTKEMKQLETSINSKISSALNLNSEGKFVFVVKKHIVDAELAKMQPIYQYLLN